MEGWMDTCMQVLLPSFVPHPIPSHPQLVPEYSKQPNKIKKGAHDQVWMDGGMVGWDRDQKRRRERRKGKGRNPPTKRVCVRDTFFRDNLNERICDVRGHVSHPSEQKERTSLQSSSSKFRWLWGESALLFFSSSSSPPPSPSHTTSTHHNQSSPEEDPFRITPNTTSLHPQGQAEGQAQAQGKHGQEGRAQGQKRSAGSSHFLTSPSHSHSNSQEQDLEQDLEQGQGQGQEKKLLSSIPPSPIITTSPSSSSPWASPVSPITATQHSIRTKHERPNKGTASPFPSPPSSLLSSTTSPPLSSPSSPVEHVHVHAHAHARRTRSISTTTISTTRTMAMATPAPHSTSRNRSNDFNAQANGYTDSHTPTTAPHRRQLKSSKSVDNLAGRARSHTVDTGVQGLRNHFHHLYVDSPSLTKTQLEAYGTPPSPADSYDRSSPIPTKLNRTGSGHSSGHSSIHGQDQDEPNHYNHRPRQQRPPQGQSQLRQDSFSPNSQPYQNGANGSSSTGATNGAANGGLQVVQSNHVASRSTPKLTLYAQTPTQHQQLIKESKETRSFNGTPTAQIDSNSKPKAKSSRLKPIVTVENTNEDHVER